jgi:signal transduction histidine kinase
MLYNDAYSAIVSNKHPKALGSSGREIFPEVWETIGPMLDSVMKQGRAVRADDLLLSLERNGYPEECYFTFSYSPILDESGGVGGVFTPVQETTEKVIGERRLRTLSNLAAVRTGKVKSAEEACHSLVAAIRENKADLPFWAIYLFENGSGGAKRVAFTGASDCFELAPQSINEAVLWPPIGDLTCGSSSCRDIASIPVVNVPKDSYGRTITQWLAMPLPKSGGGDSKGFVIAGLNPRKRLDEQYKSFMSLVADHVAATIADAEAFEQERKRADGLAEIDRAKTTFFSNASHEFRTPLTLMLGPIEAMLERANLHADVSMEELQLVHRNGLRLLKLVNTLLDFARIEAGRVNALYEPTDLARLTADTASAFTSAMEQAGLVYVIDCPSISEPVHVDREMWEKIVLNLISNAFKFTLSGSITVRLRTNGDMAVLSVEDTGTGIPLQELPRIFDRFHRVEGARGRTHEGSGIGLALLQELVKLHGGSIRAESIFGKGSTFSVSIPLGTAHLPADRLRTVPTLTSTGNATEAFVEEAFRWLPQADRPADHPTDFASDSVQAPHEQNLSGRILLAEDNADMRGYVKRLLGDRYHVEVVGDGEAALAEIRRNPPDLVLTDVMMPRLDGFQLLQALRGDPTLSTIPVILLSARAGEDARIEGMQAGADDYIVKPFTARELLARVTAHLAMSRTNENLRQSEKLAGAGRLAATVSHELNNPLAIAMNMIYLAQRDSTVEGQRHYLAGAERELKRIARLANRTLSFYRGNSPRECFSISTLVQELVEIFMVVCSTKGISIDVDAASDLLVYGSKDELAQAITNLLSNAIDAVGENGMINVRCKRYLDPKSSREMVLIVVADNGHGIGKSNRERLFEPFFTTKDRSGTGLGLWIVKDIVAKHHGSLRMRTRTHGNRKGTIVAIILPSRAPSLEVISSEAA